MFDCFCFCVIAGDNLFCNITQPFLFHSWWHILSGLGTYIWIQFAVSKYVLDTGGVVEDAGLFKQFGLPLGDLLPFVGPARE